MHFVCSKCKGIIEGPVDLVKKLCDEVETVNGFCYLGDRLNSSGGCEARVEVKQSQQEQESVRKDLGNVESYCLKIGFL